MKHLLKEELNQMKYLFGYERGKVISEQNLLTEDSKTLDLFESTLPEFWGDDFIDGTTFSEESVDPDSYKIVLLPGKPNQLIRQRGLQGFRRFYRIKVPRDSRFPSPHRLE